MEACIHRLMMSDFNNLELCGVDEVLSFDDKQIELRLKEGSLFIGGQGLKITAFSQDTSTVSITGQIDSILRENGVAEPKGLFSRFFG